MRETPKAAAAYAEYAAMGPSRSLAKLYEQLRQSNGKTTVPLRTLEGWSTAHNWQERVREHDAAIIAEKVCGLASTACAADAFSALAADADAIIEWASNACSACEAALSCAALSAELEKLDALLPIAATSCGLIMCALLARPPNASALCAIAANTPGSA